MSSDTSWGGAQGGFPNTTWGLIAGFGNLQAPGHHSSLEALCRRYWKPIYHYLRAAWAKPREDAKDLTQAFLLWLIEADVLKKYASEKASFRKYLKVLLAGFVRDDQKALARLKRGGGLKVVPLDDDGGIPEEVVADPRTATPEEILDRAWAMDVAKRVIDRVRERYRTAGKEAAFRIYEEYDLSSAREPVTYAALAARHGCTETDVRHALEEVRKAIRLDVRAELSDMVVGEQALETELHELFGL